MILGIDVGGTWVRFGYVDKNKEIRHEARFPMPEVFGSSVADFADYIENYIHDCGEKPLAVAIGLPSILDKKKRRVLSTANIAMLQDIPLADLLEEKLGIPCFLNHDVKSLLEFDIDLFGLETEDTTIIAFYVGTGFGNSVCIDGKYLSGKNGGAGEVAHMPFPGASGQCGCGNKGCAETVAAGKRLAAIREEYFPETDFSELFIKHKNEAVIEEFISNIAVVIATEVSIFDPDHIILGGGDINMPGFPREMLEEKVYHFARKPLPANNLSYRYTPDGQMNGIIGSAIYARKQLNK